MNRELEQALKRSDHFADVTNALPQDYAEALAVVMATVAEVSGVSRTLKAIVAQQAKTKVRPGSGRDSLLNQAADRLRELARPT